MHPDDSTHYIENGIHFDDGRYAIVYHVARMAFVDVLDFKFVSS